MYNRGVLRLGPGMSEGTSRLLSEQGRGVAREGQVHRVRLAAQSRLRDEIDEPNGPERRLASNVLAMLRAQQAFYKCPLVENLAVARAAERSVDCRLAKIRMKKQGYQFLPFGD